MRAAVRACWPVVLLVASLQAFAGSALLSQLTASGEVGSGRLTWWGITVYDATLYAPGGEYRPDQAFALRISYRLGFRSEDLARRSLEEIERIHGQQPDPDSLVQRLARVFPDVDSGDDIVGLHLPGKGAEFYHNGSLYGRIDDVALAQAFFSIWLDPRTSEPGLRAHLLGERQ